MDRPSALDLAFLELDTPQAPLNVGWTLRFAGRAPSLPALRRHLDARVAAVPRFRRRLVRPPLGLGAPHWVDDPGFDIARHVFSVALQAPGSEEQLRALAAALLSQPLPADRPLWRMYAIDRADDGFAVVGQAHHALVDGVAAVDVGILLFGEGAAPDGPRTWTPARGPSVALAAREAAAARARAGAAVLREAGEALRTPGGERLRGAARTLETVARPAPVTGLDRSVTHERALGFADVALDAVREAGRRHGATVNDVLLTAATVALRAELRRREETPETLRALVPVDVRGEATGDTGAIVGNRISFLAVELPVREPDPLRILQVIRHRTATAKATGDAGALDALGRAADALPGLGRRVLTRAAMRTVGFNLVVSNVPGPPVPLSLLGRPLRSVHPMVPLLHGHGVSIGAISYQGRLHVGVTADAVVLPHAQQVGRDVEAAVDALRVRTAEAAEPELTPWRARAGLVGDASRRGARDHVRPCLPPCPPPPPGP